MNNLKISAEITEFIKIYIPCAPHRTKKSSETGKEAIKSPQIVHKEDIAIPLISLPQ
jgi:hypothetical protein